MNYSPKYFKDSLPDWKKKKDPLLSRVFYRPISFYLASLAVKCRISANMISYFSVVVGITASLLFLIDSFSSRLIGAILVNIWLILDCTDGNIARGVKKQPFGEFADGISSYILVGLICTTMSFSVYLTGGLIIKPGSPWIILIGALASSSDSLMRLIYQKYQNVIHGKDIFAKEKDSDIRNDNSLVGDIRVRIEVEFGIGGILPIAILLATIFNFLDLIILYCFAYYGLSCIFSTLHLIIKSIKISRSIDRNIK